MMKDIFMPLVGRKDALKQQICDAFMNTRDALKCIHSEIFMMCRSHGHVGDRHTENFQSIIYDNYRVIATSHFFSHECKILDIFYLAAYSICDTVTAFYVRKFVTLFSAFQ